MTDEARTGPVGFEPGEIDQSASTRDARLKWVIAVDADQPEGRRANAIACVAAAFGARVPGLLGTDGIDADGVAHPGLPWAGCSLLAADAERLVALRGRAAEEEGVLVIGMPAAAQESRVYDEYLANLAGTPSADLREIAIGLIGPRKAVERLTKKLRLLG
ncbi:DUF2000 domain-containing protein [Amnibacterium setariae]|uniref:DUF2000 domain-containing protein n=1 Tax=Amnibacterium setariae TaxID=2306585 RepID=A0A3A1TXW4_9MICO|nr:DUF2000 domain-containing protein [Amnibacterium setariae]RIX28448.1 DUF2000 domain-containing protein [Amnibacterium setariae]